MPETHDGGAGIEPGAERSRLSPMQAGMLYHHLSGAPADVDLQQIVVTLPEPIDHSRLAAAWDRIVEHVPALRTSIDWRDPRHARRVVHDDLRIPMVAREPAGDREAAVAARIDAHRAGGFDPATAPLTRIELIRTGDGVFTLLWSFHHLVMDGRSTAGVLLDLFGAYEALGRGDEVVLTERPAYERYLDWLDARDGAGDAEFWRTRLSGLETATPAPGARRGSDRGSGRRLDETERRLGAGTTARIERFAAEHDTSVNAIVQAAWALVLATFSGSSDVVYGITRAVRPDGLDDADAFIGVLIQTHPVRVRVDPDRPVSAWLSDLKRAHREMGDHWLAPLADIQTWSDVPPGAPLFETLYMYDGVEMGEALAREDPAWAERTVRILERPPYPMTLYAFGRPELLLRIDTDPDRIEPGTGARLLDLLTHAIEEIAADPDRPVESIGLLSDAARARILDTWNRTDRPVEDRPFAHEAVRRRAADRGGEVALVEGDRELTYGELAEAVGRAAAGLRALGVEPGAVVGLHGDRSIETITALLAILEVGAAYLPLDPTYPAARLRFMAEDAGLRWVVEGPGAHVAWEDQVMVASVEALADAGARAERSEPHAARANDLAYLIYTSGSTGRPKGVMIEHGNLRNFLEAMDPVVDGPPGTWLSATPLSFDISVLEILWTLARGWTVVLPDPVPAPDATGGAAPPAKAAPAVGAAASPARASASPRPPESAALPFGLFYFAAASGGEGRDAYRLLLEGARFAEARGFRAIWTPERHFHAFGGLYPNPAVTGAAVAAIAPNVCVRAGSVVLPLHDPIRVAEAWAVLDNLTNGRAGVAFASGWQRNDFVLSPDHYDDRHEEMLRGIDIVQRLWRGEEVFRPGVGGESVGVRLHPRPIQPALPMWLTAAGSPETFRRAGEIGAGVLTHLLGQSVESLAELVGAYREAWQRAGHGPGPGHVVVMLHTFVGHDDAEVRELVAPPLKAYLRTSVSLIKNYSGVWASRSRPGGEKPKGDEFEQLSEEDLDALLDRAFDRYYEESGLLGPPEKCAALVESLRAVGVDEIACLIDFGVDVERALAGLEDLDELRRRFDPDAAGPHAAAGASAAPSTTADGHAPPEAGRRRGKAAGAGGEGAKLGARVAGVPELILRRNVTHLQCTPSVIRMLLADPDGRRALGRLELVLVGGEALPGGLARDLREVTEARIRNMYGPTETTVWSTTAPVSGDEEGIVSIGRPIANTRVYVLDARGEPLPEGAPGELWIGGAGVARGYHDRSALTAERFVDDPFAGPGARMYRTGDRARWRPDGTLEFLGRVDQQVKLRGHRIELGEVEAALRLNPGVEAAAVVVRGEGAAARLTAYTVGPAATDALRTWLAERLPDAMIPDDWSVLDALPLTPNGKVDRRRLPDPRRRAVAAAAPSGTSDTLAKIWARVLGLDEVGPDEDFFELGGNSLSTIQVAFEIREAFGIELPLRAFFRAPTVRALAVLVEEELVSRAADEDLDSLIDELSALSDEEARRLVERE